MILGGERLRAIHLAAAGDAGPTAVSAPGVPEVRAQPLAQSILWTPMTDLFPRPADPAGPVFVTQGVLARVLEHVTARPPGAAVGLLAGRPHRCSRTDAPYVVVDAAAALPSLPATGALGSLLAEGLARTRERGGEIVGWYRSHVFGEAALTPRDVEATAEHFPADAPLTLVVAGSGAGGGWFRRSSSAAWFQQCLPFYEMLSDDAMRAGGGRPTVVGWRNYRTTGPVVRGQSPAKAAAPVPRVLLPSGEDVDDMPALAPPRGRRGAAFWRKVAYGGAALGGALATYAVAGVRPPAAVFERAQPAAAVVATADLQARADTLAFALAAFELRSRLFNARQMTCTDLARGLVQVEAGWIGYNQARRNVGWAGGAAEADRAQAALANVEATERVFTQSGCTRP